MLMFELQPCGALRTGLYFSSCVQATVHQERPAFSVTSSVQRHMAGRAALQDGVSSDSEDVGGTDHTALAAQAADRMASAAAYAGRVQVQCPSPASRCSLPSRLCSPSHLQGQGPRLHHRRGQACMHPVA